MERHFRFSVLVFVTKLVLVEGVFYFGTGAVLFNGLMRILVSGSFVSSLFDARCAGKPVV